MKSSSGKRIAVIGSGISGLSAAYLFRALGEVHLFEAAPRLGGHANTVSAGGTPVDTGFIVYNELSYPHLTGLFKVLGVPTAKSEMSLSIRFQNPDLEWGGTNLRSMIAQKRNIFRPAFWGMVQEILRFNREARDNMLSARSSGCSLGELLIQRRYKKSFIDWYLLPMGAAIWSTPSRTMLEFPAETFLQFCLNHHLLQVDGRPEWRTVHGGSIQYVNRLAAHLPHIHLSSPVERVERRESSVEVHSRGRMHSFDWVIFATHPPQTRRILNGMDAEEKSVLECFSFQENLAQLHTDTALLPRNRSIWSAWNFHQHLDGLSEAGVSLSYWMNRLQPLPTERNLIVTLNSSKRPADVLYQENYDHPVFDRRAISAQSRLHRIQGRGGVFHCGAWTRYGFHEDGILSAVNLAKARAISIPWEAPGNHNQRGELTG